MATVASKPPLRPAPAPGLHHFRAMKFRHSKSCALEQWANASLALTQPAPPGAY